MPTPDKISFHGAMRPAGANTIPFPRRRSSDADQPARQVPGGAIAIARPAPEADFDRAVLEQRNEATATIADSMWRTEQQHPWLLGVYLLGFITGLAISHIWPWGVL